MDKKTIGIVLLSVTASVMLALNLAGERTAAASVVVSGRDYKAVTTRSQKGGDSLYILDSKTGEMAVFVYDTGSKSVRVRDVRLVRDAFSGR